jgi:hypothetical protein
MMQRFLSRDAAMMTIDEIRAAVRQLTPQEKAQVISELAGDLIQTVPHRRDGDAPQHPLCQPRWQDSAFLGANNLVNRPLALLAAPCPTLDGGWYNDKSGYPWGVSKNMSNARSTTSDGCIHNFD